MVYISRRKFLKSTSVLAAATLVTTGFDENKKKPLLAFSTLGCPDWTFMKITDFAAQHGYNGIELRGIQRELDLTKCREFSNQNIAGTLTVLKDKNLRFVDLGSSTNLHIADSEKRKSNLDEGRRFIDLAQKINCPYIRVFPNNFPKEQEKNETIDLIIKGLMELGDHAKGSNVSVLMETHGDVVKSDDLLKVMQSASHAKVGLVWDVTNMWIVTKEPPVEMYKKLKKYIHHTHIKDASLVNHKVNYKLLGQGEVPVFEAIQALEKGDYKGYYSFEWEKLWHPEIEEPEIALADYPKVMRQHFNR
ncbi:MAG: sugar phosphate isomerase/epimerase family protein [Ginsengibacter sp.]